MVTTLLIGVLFLAVGLLAGLAIFAAWTARRVEAAVPPMGRFIDVQGIRLHYVDQGSGPVVLMIHGLASQLQTFTFALSARLPAYRLIMLDRPGCGYSQTGPSGRIGTQADIVAAFLRALSVDRALIVGHSLGGAVALALALDHPRLVAGLALLAPASQQQGEVPAALRGLAIRSDVLRWIIGWTLAIPASLRGGKRYVTALFKPDPAPADYGTRGGGLLTLRPWTFRNAARDLEGAQDIAAFSRRYGQIEAPVGVLYGTSDAILDYRLHGESLIRQIPGADLELIEDGGHMVPFSAPDRSAAFIERMAAKVGLMPEHAA